jgi:hypothetical protein
MGERSAERLTRDPSRHRSEDYIDRCESELTYPGIRANRIIACQPEILRAQDQRSSRLRFAMGLGLRHIVLDLPRKRTRVSAAESRITFQLNRRGLLAWDKPVEIV